MTVLSAAIRAQVVSAICHDLRGPINTMLGWATLLQRSAPVAMQRGLQSIERATRLMAVFVADLPDILWITEEPEPQRTVIEPGALARGVADELFEESKIDVAVQLEGDDRPIACDARMVRAALRAVLFQFVRGGPSEATMRVRSMDEGVVIELRERSRGRLPLATLYRALDGVGDEQLFTTGAGLAMLVAYLSARAHRGRLEELSDGVALHFASA